MVKSNFHMQSIKPCSFARVMPDILQDTKKAHTGKEWTIHIMQACTYSIFPYVGIIQIRFNRSKFDYFLSACPTSSLL